jgi:hypothetical protein
MDQIAKQIELLEQITISSNVFITNRDCGRIYSECSKLKTLCAQNKIEDLYELSKYLYQVCEDYEATRQKLRDFKRTFNTPVIERIKFF